MANDYGYSRSAKVGFSIVAKNLEDLTKTNDLFDDLIKKGKKADSILSNLGSHYSDSGLSKFKDGLSEINDHLDKITDKSKDFASSMNDHLKSVADDSNKSAGRMSSAFSKATDKIKHGMDNISDNKEIKFKTNASQLQRDFKKTQDQTDKTKDSLSSMRSQLDRNNSSIKLASREHDSYINALKSEGNYTKASREELKGLRTSYSQLSTQLNKEKNYLAKVKDATGKTSDAYMKQSTKVNELRSHVASTKDEMARMNVTANRSHTAFGRLYNAGSKLSNMGTTVTMAMIPVAAAFKRAADEAVNLQNRYITIKNLLNTGGESSGAAKAETKAMQKENNRFALKYGVSPVAMAKGGEELIRRGYNGKQELGAHEYFLQAARASGDPYLSVVGNAAPALESFGYKNRAGNSVKKMKDYTKLVTNQMAYASDLSATNFSGMGGALKYASQVAHSAHESLASTTAAIGVMSNRGLDGSIAGTGLRKVINAFASPNLSKMSQQGPIMDKYHIKQSGFYNKNGQLKSLPDLLDYINHQTRHLTTSKKDDFARKFFGTTGQQAGLDLMELTGKKGSHNTNNLRGLTARVGNAQNMYGGKGYEERLAKKNMKSWKNQIKQFKQYMNIMGMGFAKTVLPAFTKALHLANKLLGVLIKTPSPIKKLVGFTTAFAGILASAYATSRLLRHGFNFLNGGSLFGSIGGKASKSPQGLGKLANSIGLGAGKGSEKLGLKGILKGKVAARSMGTTLGKTISAGVGIGVAADAGYNIYKGIKSKNKKKRYKDIGKGVGTAVGGGIGFYFGGPAGAAVGASIGNAVGGWAGNAIHKFSKTKMGHRIGKQLKPVAKAFSSAGKYISKSWNSTVKGLKKPFESAWHSISKSFNQIAPKVGKSFSTIMKYTKPLRKIWKNVFVTELSTSIKIFGHLLGGAFKVVGTIFKGIAEVVKGVAKIVGGTFSGVSDLIHGRWSKAWKDAKEVISGFYDALKGEFDAIGGLIKDTFGTIGKIIGDVTGGVSSLIGKLTGAHNRKTHSHHSSRSVKAHARGTSSLSGANSALVGEGGPELAYTVNGRHARILGANGPEITHVKHGERILNHRDTKKVLSGSYGHVLPGYAVGNTKLGSSNSLKSVKKLSKKTVKDYKDLSNGSSKQLDKFSNLSKSKWSNIHKVTSKITDNMQKKTVTDYDQLQKGSYKQLVQFDKGNTSKWRNITSDTKHYTNQSKNQAISTYDAMQKGVQKQMGQLQSGVISSAKGTAKGFGGALGKMDNYAHSAMSNTVHQLNGGIKGIDKVLNQFGGNSSVINTIRYATGSNGALTRNQLAMVNDAGYGSRQEAIVHHGNVILPSGRNRMMALQKGDQVLNGSQTQKLASMYGLSHFAKGSGVSDSELRKIAKNNAKNPTKAFNTSFTINLKENGHALQNGTTGMAKGGSTKYGDPWSSAMWSYIEGLIQAGGTGSGTKGKFLQEAIKLGKSAHLRYSEAANLRLGPNAYDCSGLVYESLKHLGITLPGSTTGPEYAATKSVPWSKGEPGDLAFYNGHVGIVSSTAGEGRMWNAENPTNGIKYGPIKDFGGGFKGLRSVPGLSDKSSKKNNSTSSLQKLVKKELGSKAVSWIKKHLQVSLGNVGSLSLGGDIASRAKKMAAAIKKAYPAATLAGIAGVLGNWEQESGLSPSAIDPADHGSGLGQWTNVGGSRRESKMRAYLKRHGMRWNNAGGQLDYALHEPGASGMLKKALRMSSPTAAANYFFSTWESGGNEDNSGGKRTSNARGIYKVLKGHRNGGWSSVPAIFGEKNGEPEVAINPKRSSADRLLMQAIAKRVREAPSSIFGKLFNSSKRQKEIDDIKKFSPANFKIAPTSKKPAKVTEQKAVFSPNITVNVNVSSSANAKKVGNEVAKQVEDIVQRMFKKEYNVTETGTL